MSWGAIIDALVKRRLAERQPDADRPTTYYCPDCGVFGQDEFPVACWVCGGMDQLIGKPIPVPMGAQRVRLQPGEDLSGLSWADILAGTAEPEVRAAVEEREDEW